MKTATDELLTCETGAKGSQSSTGTDMPGQMGLVKTVYDPDDGSVPAWDDFSGTLVETSAALVFETTERYDELIEEEADTSTINNGDFESNVAV